MTNEEILATLDKQHVSRADALIAIVSADTFADRAKQPTGEDYETYCDALYMAWAYNDLNICDANNALVACLDDGHPLQDVFDNPNLVRDYIL